MSGSEEYGFKGGTRIQQLIRFYDEQGLELEEEDSSENESEQEEEEEEDSVDGKGWLSESDIIFGGGTRKEKSTDTGRGISCLAAAAAMNHNQKGVFCTLAP